MRLQDDRFKWHPAAQIAGFDRPETRPSDGTSGAIPDHPAPYALWSAAARSEKGLSFRIGGGREQPQSGLQPMFETLTSGTSGNPRRICRSQASWIMSFTMNAQLFGIGPGTTVAVLGQLIHSLSLYGALEALHLGASLHVLADLRPDRQRLALAQTKIEVVYATPAQARLLTDGAGPVLPALRLILIGGSKLDTVLRARFADIAPNAEIREFYGAAETSFLTLAGPDDPPASVGRAYPGVVLKLCDGQGNLVPNGAQGEIWVQSPYLFAGYASDPGGAVWKDGWLSIGEIGRIEAGHVYLSGRKSRIVQIADQAVFPDEIEAFLATCQGIDRIAVIPQPDAKRGAVLIAVAMGDASFANVILAATRAQFGPLKSPRRIIWRDNWPILPSGKPDLAALARDVS